MSVLCVMKAMIRICPPQTGRSSGNASQMRAISAAHRTGLSVLGHRLVEQHQTVHHAL
jgi:hypothetical protein